MKFCYLDESGTGSEPIAVMAGIMVDAQRMHVTKGVWEDFLALLSTVARRPVAEFHAKDFYSGNGSWRGTNGQTRSDIIEAILGWVAKRKHKITFSGVDKSVFQAMRQSNAVPVELTSAWMAVASHSVLVLQKHNRREEKTKGHTVLVFDRKMNEEAHLTDFVHRPPAWTDSFYQRAKKEAQLGHIVDVPYFADSKPVLLTQIADLISYLLREFAELAGSLRTEDYPGETAKLTRWVGLIAQLALPTSSRYPSKGRCQTAQLYRDLAPASIRTL